MVTGLVGGVTGDCGPAPDFTPTGQGLAPHTIGLDNLCDDQANVWGPGADSAFGLLYSLCQFALCAAAAMKLWDMAESAFGGGER